MEVKAKKALGQHFLTDQKIAKAIVAALDKDTCKSKENRLPVLEVGPGMGVLSQYMLADPAIDLKMIEIDTESVDYLKRTFGLTSTRIGDNNPKDRIIEGDFLKTDLATLFGSPFRIIGNFPYNISSQIFFRILDYRDLVPMTVCMIQKEVAERIAEKPGSKTYGILSVLLQAWYDIEYLFTVGPGAFAPPPKVHSAVIRLTRNSRTSLGCDEPLFKTIVKTSFGQRRKTLRNSLKPLIAKKEASGDLIPTDLEILGERPERLSVEDFIVLTNMLA